jgi:hypothetical protein
MILNLFSTTSSYIRGIFQTKGLHPFGIMFGLMVGPANSSFQIHGILFLDILT